MTYQYNKMPFPELDIVYDDEENIYYAEIISGHFKNLIILNNETKTGLIDDLTSFAKDNIDGDFKELLDEAIYKINSLKCNLLIYKYYYDLLSKEDQIILKFKGFKII